MRSARSIPLFFGLVAALACPLWLASEALGTMGAMRIPVADLALAFVPMTAALLLTALRPGAGGPLTLLRRSFDPRIAGKRGMAATLLLAPLIYLLTAAVMAATGQLVLPHGNPWTLALLLAGFFVLAAGEEIGWTGYATDPLHARYGALGAALILAVPWWLAHLPSMLQMGATGIDIAWWGLGAAAVRVLIVWLYNNSARSVFAVILFHALLNTGRIATFPLIGGRYDPDYQTTAHLVSFGLAVAAILTWRPRPPAGQGR